MPFSRAISASLRAISVGPVMGRGPGTVQPKPAASSKSAEKCAAMASSFFGTQPTLTQVPPQ